MTISPPRMIPVMCIVVTMVFIVFGHRFSLWEEPFLTILWIGLLYAILVSAILIGLIKITGRRVLEKPLQIQDKTMRVIICGALSPIIIIFGLAKAETWDAPMLTILGMSIIIVVIYVVAIWILLKLQARWR